MTREVAGAEEQRHDAPDLSFFEGHPAPASSGLSVREVLGATKRQDWFWVCSLQCFGHKGVL